MKVRPILTVVEDHANFICNVFVLGDNCAAFSVSTQVLAGIKAEAPGGSHGSGCFIFVFGSVGLAGIFDDHEIMFLRYCQNRIQVDRLAI